MSRRAFRSLGFTACTVLLCCSVARAGVEDAEYTRLARVSLIEGAVSYEMASETEWAAASVNMPLEPGDRVYTGKEGRVEIEFEDGSVLRLDEDTDIEILSLSDEIVHVRMLLGLAALTSSGEAPFEVSTPGGSFRAVRKGVYRFDVSENGDTDAIVRKGELDAVNQGFSDRIEKGELLHVSPSAGGRFEVSRYERRDSWDDWTDRRSADAIAYRSRKYVPNTVSMGVSELDKHGRWVSVEYGDAWVPDDVDDDWSPYSVGRWCYRPRLGWTWISYERWGWLPYHYGRWYRNPRHGWCWLPGPSFSFHFWSPGLVSFYSGEGWVSWCLLGPGDYYDIGNYRYDRGLHGRYLAHMRNLHTRRAGDHFNRHAHNAFRGAPLDRFREGRPDRGTSLGRWGSASEHWKKGSLVSGRLHVTPTRVSFRANPHVSPAPPRVESSHPAIVRHAPPPGVSRGRFVRVGDSEARAPSSRTGSTWSGRSNPKSRWNPDGRRLNSAAPRTRRQREDLPERSRESGDSRWRVEDRESEGEKRGEPEPSSGDEGMNRPDDPSSDLRRSGGTGGSRVFRSHPTTGARRSADRHRDGKPDGRREDDRKQGKSPSAPQEKKVEQGESPKPNPMPPKERKLGRWGSADE